MTIIISDRVRETATGAWATGDITLLGAATGYQSFQAGIGTGNQCYYTAVSGVIWETGIGTLANSTTLQRNTLLTLSGPTVGPIKGYFTGGSSGGPPLLAKTDKLTFASDTTVAQTTANLTLARQYVTGVCEGTKGYVAGGDTDGNPHYTALTDKITFSNDTTIAQTTANLSTTRDSCAGVSQGSTKGYFAGGEPATSITDKITFSGDTTAAQTTANLSFDRSSAGGVAQSGIKGYFVSGVGSSIPRVFTDLIKFSNDTTAAQTSADLSPGRYYCGSAGDGTTKGYVAGGTTGGGSTFTTASKISFSSDTIAAQASASLSLARYNLTGVSGPSGYFAGGVTNAVTQALTDKTYFANDTTAAQTTANLSAVAGSHTGVSLEWQYPTGTQSLNIMSSLPSGFVTTARSAKDLLVTAGEGMSIRDSVYISKTDGKAYKTRADVLQSGSKALLRGFVTEGNTQGYVAGGSTDASTHVATADKTLFASDITAATTTANLSVGRYGAAAVSQGATKGYFAGGNSGAAVTTTDQITYANDTTSAQTTASLSAVRGLGMGCSDYITKGYVAGGVTGGSFTSAVTDKITFATDTTSAQVSANLSIARGQGANVSEGSKGYFCGGDDTGVPHPISTTDKVVFVTDVTAAQASANLITARFALAGCSRLGSAGYMSGGLGALSSVKALTDKLIYSTDTTVSQTTANLSQARYAVTGLSEGTVKSYVYGGRTDSVTFVATADRIAFATDTTAAQLSANLSSVRIRAAGLENSAPSVFMMRIAGTITGYSGLTAGRIQYVDNASGPITETPPTNAIPVGIALSSTDIFINTQGYKVIKYFVGTKGYCAGGESATTPTRVATADKLTFSNDTRTATTTANLTQIRNMVVGLANFDNKGYFLGGATGALPAVTTADMLTFSTDATVAKTTANLTQARQEAAALSERTSKGYIAGGLTGTSLAVATTDKLIFNTDVTTAATTANLSAVRAAGAGMSQGNYKGYWLGGYTGANVEVVTSDIIQFSSDTTAARTTANLAAVRSHATAISDGRDRGWVCGGQSGTAAANNTIYRMVFNTDTTSAAITATLSTARWGSGGLSEGGSKGYILGGRSAAELATTDLFKFGPETITATAGANLSTVRSYVGSCADTGL